MVAIDGLTSIDLWASRGYSTQMTQIHKPIKASAELYIYMQRQFRSPEITYINPGMYRMMSTHACISDTKEETEDDGLKIK